MDTPNACDEKRKGYDYAYCPLSERELTNPEVELRGTEFLRARRSQCASVIQLEKGLVSIETENILNKYPSDDVYKSLKGDLTKKYNITRLEIESLHNSLTQIGKDEQWFD